MELRRTMFFAMSAALDELEDALDEIDLEAQTDPKEAEFASALILVRLALDKLYGLELV